MLHKTVLHTGQRQDRDKASKKSKGKLLSPPVPRKCSESEWASESGFSSHLFFLGPKRFRFQGHNYFYSGDVAPYKKIKYDWLDGRNFCRWLLMVNCRCHCNQPQKTREYCMDLVSLETQQENDYIQNWLESRNLTYTWTSGRYEGLQSITINRYHHHLTSGFVILTAATGQIWSPSTLKDGFGQAQIRRLHQPTKSMRGKLLLPTSVFFPTPKLSS